MIPLAKIRETPDLYRNGAADKGESAPIDEILSLDTQARSLRSQMEDLRAQQKRGSVVAKGEKPNVAAMKALKARIQELDGQVTLLDEDLHNLLLNVANPPHESVPRGKDEHDNVVARTWGEPKTFDFTPLAHYDLGETLQVFDFARAAKISGARFAILTHWGPRLQRALVAYMIQMATNHGYAELSVPFLVRSEAMVGTANLPKFGDDAFATTDGMWLVPTAEVPVTNYYREEILEEAHLPIAHVAHSACFRREAGSAGRDTRGFIRLHQFDKVELVRFVHPSRSLEELELLTSHAESILQGLGISYRVLSMCTGDMGFAQWKKYDIEAWAPGMERWLEVSSCSVFGDFQARRASIRFRPTGGGALDFVHTLNGSALALPRTLSALMETYQNKDGSITVPEVLRPYLGCDLLTAP